MWENEKIDLLRKLKDVTRKLEELQDEQKMS